MLFKKKTKTIMEITPEDRFEIVYDYIKDLPKGDFTRFIEGIQFAWQGYDKALRVQTRDAKKDADIQASDKALEYEEIGK